MYNQFWRQTAFDRPTYLYIDNNTDLKFELFKTEVKSGVLVTDPQSVIYPGGEATFVADQTGLVGPSGFATYKAQYYKSDVYVTFYWSHPEGATSSVYYGYSSPYGLFYIVPENNADKNQKPTNQNATIKDWTTNKNEYENVLALNPTGHTQSVTYTIKYSLGHA